MKLEGSAVAEEIRALATQSFRVSFHNEVRSEVEGFDMIQRMYEWDAFEARTGLIIPHKKMPL